LKTRSQRQRLAQRLRAAGKDEKFIQKRLSLKKNALRPRATERPGDQVPVDESVEEYAKRKGAKKE
jgi:hypothetical protein